MRSAGFISVIFPFLITAPSIADAQDSAPSTGETTTAETPPAEAPRAREPQAAVRTVRVTGGRTREEGDAAPARAVPLLARCAAEGRESRGDDTHVELAVDRGGRVRATILVDAGDAGRPVPRGVEDWRACLVRNLQRLRFERGEAGTVEVRVHWDESSAPHASAVGGLGRRGSTSLPGAMRSDESVRETAAPYSRDTLVRIVRAHRGELRRCYDHGLATRPDLDGAIEARWTIAADGSVSAASADSDTIGMPSVRECVLARLRQWQFPAPEGGAPVEVTYPFRMEGHQHHASH